MAQKTITITARSDTNITIRQFKNGRAASRYMMKKKADGYAVEATVTFDAIVFYPKTARKARLFRAVG